METIPGVAKVSVGFRDKRSSQVSELVLENDDRLSVNEEGSLNLVLTFNEYHDLSLFSVSFPNQMANLPKDKRLNYLQPYKENGQQKVKLEIEVYQRERLLVPAYYPKNHMVAIVIDGTGKIDLFEIGVVSRGGDFFVVSQYKYSGVCFVKITGMRQQIVCPQFDNWPDLLLKLPQVVSRSRVKCQEYTDQKKVQKNNIPVSEFFDDGIGYLAFWDALKHGGVGKIKIAQDKLVRAPWNNFINPSKLSELKSGQRVKFQEVRPVNGKTNELEAIGIEIL